jgi:DNA-directed RNA polymerase subunit K/omega
MAFEHPLEIDRNDGLLAAARREMAMDAIRIEPEEDL